MRNINLVNVKKISKNKNILENKLNVKLSIKGKDLIISGKELDEYLAYKVISAIQANFPLNIALLLLDEDYMMEDIYIKNVTRRKNVHEIRARIIGKKGKTLKTLTELSDCYIILHNNTVSLIGRAEEIESAIQAITSLIRGNKQSSVYAYLEKSKRLKKENNLKSMKIKHQT